MLVLTWLALKEDLHGSQLLARYDYACQVRHLIK